MIDRKVCDQLISMRERSRFVRGLVSWVGFKQTAIEYERDERFAGETKYPLKKMLRFSMDGITSFSYKPLKMASLLGFLLSFFSVIWMMVVLYLKLFTNLTVTGWSSLLMAILFFNGVVLIMLGIIGEYIGRIYDEVKHRPLYILKDGWRVGQKNEKVPYYVE